MNRQVQALLALNPILYANQGLKTTPPQAA
ncbi:hypothetical protein GGP83_003408 [Salinibacter ruber]|uniref:Uncharacterized protein n=1 Tax=Salinibacter ruber TaxID=146919 RepID=A0A9X2Z5X2_9BACT|nr:hypothetical protein [Salinibacter ruber]